MATASPVPRRRAREAGGVTRPFYRIEGNGRCCRASGRLQQDRPSLGRAALAAGGAREDAIRILVVDDEINLLRALETGLEAEGFAVDTAATGTDALWLAREAEYAAIVLDLMLPDLSGFRVCERLRAAEDWTPILMLTAKDGDLDQVEALDTGADDYLTKPFSFPVLVARLRALIRRGAAERPVVQVVGDLVLDPASRRVERGGVPIPLTAREFSVLEYLVSRAGDVVSKRDVLGAVWDFDFDGDPNIVEVYIRTLRNKIDRPFGVDTIRTQRGAGYSLVPR